MAKWDEEKMADLTRKLADTAIDYKTRCEELETKLAKAVEALESVISCSNDVHIVQDAETILAELKGQKDE